MEKNNWDDRDSTYSIFISEAENTRPNIVAILVQKDISHMSMSIYYFINERLILTNKTQC